MTTDLVLYCILINMHASSEFYTAQRGVGSGVFELVMMSKDTGISSLMII